MLDLVVIVSDTTPVGYVTQCLQSVQRAIERSPFPVNFVRARGVPGHIGKARLQSLERCAQPYVAWVDDDDMLLPHALAAVSSALQSAPSSVHAREIAQLANGTLIFNEDRHHLSVYHRDIVNTVDFAAFPANEDLLRAAGAGPSPVDVFQWVYVRRIWRSAGASLRSKS